MYIHLSRIYTYLSRTLGSHLKSKITSFPRNDFFCAKKIVSIFLNRQEELDKKLDIKPHLLIEISWFLVFLWWKNKFQRRNFPCGDDDTRCRPQIAKSRKIFFLSRPPHSHSQKRISWCMQSSGRRKSTVVRVGEILSCKGWSISGENLMSIMIPDDYELPTDWCPATLPQPAESQLS